MKFLKRLLVIILIIESKLILAKYKPFIIAVTGSVGKTSTKDAIYIALKSFCKYVRKSEKSLNSEIGLPLTIIGAPNAWYSLSGWLKNIIKGLILIIKHSSYPDTLVLELGADHPGDIRNVASWLKPDIAVITKVSRTPVHVEFFKSPEEVFEEKASLATSVKLGGSVVLFADDEKVMSIVKRLNDNIKVLSFGLDEKASIRGALGNTLYELPNHPNGFEFTINVDGQNYDLKMNGVIGNVYIYPLLAGVAVAKARGADISIITKALLEYEAPRGRMNLIAGINDSTIIDDTYNSSPDAVVSALSTLKGLETTGKKIAILGDMMELGKYASEEHRKIGKQLVDVVSEIVTVGSRAQLMADEAIKSGFSSDYVHSFARSTEVADFIIPRIAPGDIVLVKGSQSIRMERIVAALLKEPQKADKLLVRQEREWLEKK